MLRERETSYIQNPVFISLETKVFRVKLTYLIRKETYTFTIILRRDVFADSIEVFFHQSTHYSCIFQATTTVPAVTVLTLTDTGTRLIQIKFVLKQLKR